MAAAHRPEVASHGGDSNASCCKRAVSEPTQAACTRHSMRQEASRARATPVGGRLGQALDEERVPHATHPANACTDDGSTCGERREARRGRHAQARDSRDGRGACGDVLPAVTIGEPGQRQSAQAPRCEHDRLGRDEGRRIDTEFGGHVVVDQHWRQDEHDGAAI
eukprot:7104586-Prymnesium_polylepis.1